MARKKADQTDKNFKETIDKAALPDEWIPRPLRGGIDSKPPLPQSGYACCYETVWKGDVPRKDYEIFAGPFDKLETALDCAPIRSPLELVAKPKTIIIIRYSAQTAGKAKDPEVMYRWHVPPSGLPHWRKV